MIHVRFTCRAATCVMVVAGWAAWTACGQQPAPTSQQAAVRSPETQPAVPATQPAERTPITARVLEVRGDVKHAPLDSGDWQPCQVDEQYPAETMILTGLRSSVKFQIGADDTYTAMVIEPASKILISEAYTTADSKRVNIGVGYGRIRAGVAEGGLKSDFTVESPVATLSKRGTWNFGMSFERGTDRFEVFLLGSGLVDAFNKETNAGRRLSPGEFVTQLMRRWLDEVQIHRNVAIADILGQGDMVVAFNRMEQEGLRVLNPEGGQTVLIDLSTSSSQSDFAQLVHQNLPSNLPPIAIGTRLRSEGFFGTGRGDELIPLIIGSDSTLAQKGLAKPGTYNFRRSALEGWLQQRGNK